MEEELRKEEKQKSEGGEGRRGLQIRETLIQGILGPKITREPPRTNCTKEWNYPTEQTYRGNGDFKFYQNLNLCLMSSLWVWEELQLYVESKPWSLFRWLEKYNEPKKTPDPTEIWGICPHQESIPGLFVHQSNTSPISRPVGGHKSKSFNHSNLEQKYFFFLAFLIFKFSVPKISIMDTFFSKKTFTKRSVTPVQLVRQKRCSLNNKQTTSKQQALCEDHSSK